MRETGGAEAVTRRRLVGIASVAGIRGLPGAEAYSASKAAAISYLESLRLEMAPAGLRVVTIAPGYIATPMTAINPYRMPFLLPADEAARRFAAAVERASATPSSRGRWGSLPSCCACCRTGFTTGCS